MELEAREHHQVMLVVIHPSGRLRLSEAQAGAPSVVRRVEATAAEPLEIKALRKQAAGTILSREALVLELEGLLCLPQPERPASPPPDPACMGMAEEAPEGCRGGIQRQVVAGVVAY